MTWNIEADSNETIEVIADRRQWRLEQLEQTTELLADKVRDAHASGEEIVTIAKRARVSRPTIYRWIGHTETKE